MPEKRNWIARMVVLFQNLELGVVYNKSNIRDVLKNKFNDAISLPTTKDLLEAIIKAQSNGLVFRVKNKTRKLIEKKTVGKDPLFELIEVE